MTPCYERPVEIVPEISKAQMIEVDRAMIEDYNIELIQMMENAGRALAHLARHQFFGSKPPGSRIVVLADLGVPPELYQKFLNLQVGPIFAQSDILLLD